MEQSGRNQWQSVANGDAPSGHRFPLGMEKELDRSARVPSRATAHYFAEHDQQAAALLQRRALDFLEALVGDEFRAARRSHTFEATGRCVVRRRVHDERAASAIERGEAKSTCVSTRVFSSFATRTGRGPTGVVDDFEAGTLSERVGKQFTGRNVACDRRDIGLVR